ncbi:hypothetical protein L7F22_052319 [Adiantum nelumboides]|nr:hypothetical protein [Adiantum nelumboides]
MALYLRGRTPQIQGLHMPIDGFPHLVEQEYVDDTMIFCQFWTGTFREGSPYYGVTTSGTYPVQARPPIFSKLSLRHYGKLLSRLLLPWKLLPRHGSIAADTIFYPFGTRMFVPGYGWGVVEDTGSAIKGPKRIDVYHKSHKDALVWGRQKVTVLVVLPGQSTIDGLSIPGALKTLLKMLDWLMHLVF